MKLKCAWCGISLPSNGEPHGDDDGRVSHGICTECAEVLIGQSGVPMRQFLQSLQVPLMVVTGEGRVVDVNDPGSTLVGQERSEILGLLSGDVFQCVNASLPGGCGKTVHCSGCTLRNTIEETYRTGESLMRVPATLDVRRGAGHEEADFFVSTAKVGDRVVLRVDRADAPA